MRKISRFVSIVLSLFLVSSFSPGNFSYAATEEFQNFDATAKYARDLYEGKIMPRNDDPNLSEQLSKMGDGTGDHGKIIDVRKISEDRGASVYEAVVIQTEKVKLEYNGIRTASSALQASLLQELPILMALSGSDEDIFCDVTYFTTMVYSRKTSPDPSIDYCYKITSVKGGVISRSDLQIAVSKIVLGYVEHGEYWVNGEGTGGVATIKNLAKYTKTNPVTGTTYTTSGPTQNYYYNIEDEFSGIQTRTTIYIRRLNSGFTANSYLEFVKGTAYGDW